MKMTQRNIAPVFFAIALISTAIFLLTQKKSNYDDYDRLMW